MFEVKVTESFKKAAKLLIRKYPSLKDELEELIISLEEEPKQGDSLGNSCFKIRIAVKSKGKGKRGGARIITHIKIVEEYVFLLYVYSKGDKDDISNQELKEWLNDIS